jgi:steroid 5-alpha reductase family enzyme
LSAEMLKGIHPFVLAVVAALFILSTVILFSNTDATFKTVYRVICIVMVFCALVFEEYRIYHDQPNYEKKIRELKK